MDNKINFTGGFWIKAPGKRAWQNFEKALQPINKQVFQQFTEEGDKFVAIKTHYDKEILELLLKRKFKFSFYPDINLKNRLDTWDVKGAHEIVGAQTNVISGTKGIRTYIKSLKKNVSYLKI